MLDASSWLRHFLAALTTQPAPPAPSLTIAPVLPPVAGAGSLVTADLLRGLGAQDADAWAPLLARACAAHEIATPRCLAAFLANVLVETGGLSRLVESLNYRPDVLLSQWPSHFTPASAQALGRTANHAADQREIAEAAYGGRLGNGPPGSGDGWQFRGRGLIQLTGRANYQKFATRIGMPIADLPAHLETRAGAADSAAAYWQRVGCNAPAEAGDIRQVRLLVNGGLVGLDKVTTNYRAACAVLGTTP